MSHILEEIFFAFLLEGKCYKVNCWLCLSLVKIICLFLESMKIIRKTSKTLNLTWMKKMWRRRFKFIPNFIPNYLWIICCLFSKGYLVIIIKKGKVFNLFKFIKHINYWKLLSFQKLNYKSIKYSTFNI